MTSQEKYLAERAKYASIIIKIGTKYRKKAGGSAIYTILEANEDDDQALMENQTGYQVRKTLHWCRKNLEEIIQ